jgi:site-specific recombinase XerD
MKGANQFPILLESFFMDRLMRQRQASPHTIASYRDTFRLLMQYAQQRLCKTPSQLIMPDLDTPFLGAFLDHLEQKRDNSAGSRNVRLAAIHSFFRYVSLHAPEYNALAQRVLAMQSKRYARRPICFLTPVEIDALLSATVLIVPLLLSGWAMKTSKLRRCIYRPTCRSKKRHWQKLRPRGLAPLATSPLIVSWPS